MRYTSIPGPRSFDALRSIRDAVPLVPTDEEDCCARIASLTGVAGRDEAREWLRFLQALELVSEGKRGFHRIRDAPDSEAIADSFRENVFGAREVLTVASRTGRSTRRARSRLSGDPY